jgi:hypothetical protein
MFGKILGLICNISFYSFAFIFWCIFCATLFVGYDVVKNNLKLYRLADNFQSIQHYPHSQKVLSKRAVGLLRGNGNHCDFFVGQLRQYEGNKEDVKEFYPQWKDEIGGNYVGLVFLENSKFTDEDAYWNLPYDMNEESYWIGEVEDENERYFIVYFLDVGNEPRFDIRCH